jgi:hypothetical protein
MNQYQEFLNQLQKRGSKPHKISHCLGSRDAFHWVRKNKWKATGGKTVDKQLYSKIVSEIHKVLVESLLEGHELELPYQMGSLILVRTPSKVYYDNGELKTNYRTDWKKTLNYRFYEDPEGHQLIKHIEPFIYTVKYYKRGARYHNRKFYNFRANRSLLREVRAAMERGKMNVGTIRSHNYKDVFMNRQEKRSMREI